MNLADIEIAYPTELSDEQKRFVFDAFRSAFPNEVSEWIEIEKGRLDRGEDGLKPISRLFRKYIMENTSCSSNMASASLFMNMRGIIHNELN